MSNTKLLLESIQKSLTESKNDLYYCKVTYSYSDSNSKYYEYVNVQDNKYKLTFDIKEATPLSKEEWNNLLSTEEWTKLLKINLITDNKYKISFLKANSDSSFIILHYVPRKGQGWEGSLDLSEFKEELKKNQITVTDIVTGTKHYRFGSPDKYYMFYIPKSDKNKAERFVNYAKDICDVELIDNNN